MSYLIIWFIHAILFKSYFVASILSPYWAVQVGLLTPLTFAWHRLCPLAAFTSVCTFFTMESGDSEFQNFTLPILKTFLEARSQNVSGNKQ